MNESNDYETQLRLQRLEDKKTISHEEHEADLARLEAKITVLWFIAGGGAAIGLLGTLLGAFGLGG